MAEKNYSDKVVERYSGGNKQYRQANFDRQTIDEEARTAWLSFSSEEEYERTFGIEILDHENKSIRLGRMKDGAALLHNHNWDDQIGAVREVEIGDDRRGRARVQFSRSARAEEIWQDVLDGIRTKVSVGYFVHAMQLEKEQDDGPSVYRVTDWEPFEVSIVSVPADSTVGVGRSAEEKEKDPADDLRDNDNGEVKMSETNPVHEVDVRAIEADAKEKARKAENSRIREIDSLGEKHQAGDLAAEFRANGKSVDEFRMALLEKIGTVQRVDSSPDIGLNERESEGFSFIRAINAMANPTDLKAREAASFEFEASRAVEDKMGRSAQGLFVPAEVLRRDMTVGTDADGGYLVGTDHRGDSFIDVLRNRMMVMQMGATELTGLVGDVAVPAMTAGHTGYWVAESGAPTESKPTMAQKSLTPHTCGAFDDISRKLLKQSDPSAEALVRNDIAATVALTIDLAALHGTGSNNQPAGIAATSGIGSVAGGTNGLAPAWSHIVKLETEVAQDNADVGSVGYLTNAKVRGKLRQIFPNTTGGDTPLWQNGNEPGFGMLNGYRAGVSNQVSSTLTKGSSSGVCSAIFFGNWADLVIGMWGTLDLLVDPYTGSSSGTVRVVGLQDVDVMIRRAQSFSAMLDALTT
jgi:HK97 family phage major capsid protein/HK97 family phage prohead protease